MKTVVTLVHASTITSSTDFLSHNLNGGGYIALRHDTTNSRRAIAMSEPLPLSVRDVNLRSEPAAIE